MIDYITAFIYTKGRKPELLCEITCFTSPRAALYFLKQPVIMRWSISPEEWTKVPPKQRDKDARLRWIDSVVNAVAFHNTKDFS